MVHTKTIFAIATILIIQARGNEIVLHGHGKDGSYSEFRKSESSLPGGVSKTVMVTRRMLGSPVSSLNLISSTFGGIGKPGLPNFGVDSQWNLPSHYSGAIHGNLWNNEQGSTSADNKWNSGASWNINQQPDVFGVNPSYPPNNLPWNLPSPIGSLGINYPKYENIQSGLISPPIGSGSSQWYGPNSNLDWNPSTQPSLVDQWTSKPQQIDSSVWGSPQIGVNYPGNNIANWWGNSQNGGNVNYPGNPFVNFNPEWNSNTVPGFNQNPLPNVVPGFNINALPTAVPGFNINALPNAVPGFNLNAGPVPNWLRARSDFPSAVEKRSADEVNEDSAEGHWLNK